MMRNIIFLIQLLKFYLCIASTLHFSDQVKVAPEQVIWDVPMFWNNDVYTGRHFDELVSSFNGDDRIVNRHTVLILYEDDTHDDILSFALNNKGLPQEFFLNFVKYNYHSTPRHVWYPLLGRDNLVERYIDGKPEPLSPYIFFLEAGSPLDQSLMFPIDDYDLDDEPEQFKGWVWNNLQMHIHIENHLESTLVVKSLGDGPKQEEFIIEPAHQVKMLTFVSKRICLHLEENDTLAYAMLVEQGMEDSRIIINQGTVLKEVDSTVWLQQTADSVVRNSDMMKKYAMTLGEVYLRSFKQPLLTESFTPIGYEKKTIPEELLNELLKFYENNQESREPGCILGDGNKNGGDIECTTIPMALNVKQKLAEYLKPFVTAWCDCDLEMTHVYGLSEFWDNSMMHGMLGKVTDHVISIELVIKKDLRDQPDWELEILDTKGLIQVHHLNVGEMLMYESSSVFIKRPRGFLGRSYVTLGVHFRPKIGWSWRLASEDTVLTNGTMEDSLLILNTPATLRPEFRPKPEDSPVHKEL